MCSKPSAAPTVAAMATSRKAAVKVCRRPEGAVMAVIGVLSCAARQSVQISDQQIKQNEGSRAQTGDEAETFLDEFADRLAIGLQEPGEEVEAGAAGDDG